MAVLLEEAIAQLRERVEYAVGHGVAVEVPMGQEPVTRVKTTWLPEYEVRRVVAHSEEHRIQDAADAGVAEPGDQGVDMGAALQDDNLLGGLHVGGRDRDAAVPHIAVHDLIGDRVHQPGVAAGEVIDTIDSLGLEALAGGGGVLLEQGPDVLARERAQGGGLGAHVERRRRAEPLERRAFVPGEHVVTHLAHPDERHAAGERGGAAIEVSCAELGQEGDQIAWKRPSRLR